MVKSLVNCEKKILAETLTRGTELEASPVRLPQTTSEPTPWATRRKPSPTHVFFMSLVCIVNPKTNVLLGRALNERTAKRDVRSFVFAFDLRHTSKVLNDIAIFSLLIHTRITLRTTKRAECSRQVREKTLNSYARKSI